MKRVLHITCGLFRNGTETFIMNVFRNIDRSQISFDFLLYSKAENGYEEEARELGANIYYYPPRKKGLLKYRNSLHSFFKNNAHKYDAVHFCGNSFTELLPLKLAKRYGIPVRIAHSHNSSTSGLHNKIFHLWNRKNIGNIATHYLACSETARAWGFGKSKIFFNSEVITNGIELRKYKFNAEDRQEIRKELGINESTFLICHTGAFREVKNHPFLINLFEQIRKINPDSKLVLCGSGSEENKIRLLVKNKRLEDAVIFTGSRNDIHKILSASDVYVFPSLYEGLPFALIEAQANGLPVIASDTISKEIMLTQNISFVPLSQDFSYWASKIIDSKRTTEKEPDSRLLKYDIEGTCFRLMEIYNGKSNNQAKKENKI